MKNELVLYEGVEAHIKDGQPYLSQKQIVQLSNGNKGHVSTYLREGVKAGILEDRFVVKFTTNLSAEGGRRNVLHYPLDHVLYVFSRMNLTEQTIKYHKWALDLQVRYLMKGYVLNEQHLRVDRAARMNLVEEIRAIRLDEQDYVFEVEAFLQRLELLPGRYDMAELQNLVHQHVLGGTAAEIVAARVGQQTSYGHLRTAKTYMTTIELKAERDIWEMFRYALARRLNLDNLPRPYILMQQVCKAATGRKRPEQLLPPSTWKKTMKLLPEWVQ